jgi:DNA-binding transcriptional LysR family regulator
LELRHLRYFVVLAEELHFARAAERLNIAPPTLTVQIQEVERRLGASLFKRSRRSVELTQAGKIFLAEARDVLERFERAETIGRRAAQGQIGWLEIGYVGSAAYAGVLQEHVYRFRHSYPEIEVHTQELKMFDLPELVRTGEIDIGFVRTPMALPAGLSKKIVLRDRFCLALPETHELTQQSDDPTPAQLSREPFVVPEQLAGTTEVARRGRFTPHIVSQPGAMSAVLTEVSLGRGIAVVPDSVSNVLRMPNLCYRDIAGKPIHSEIAIIHLSDENPIRAMFIDQIA